MKRHTWLLAAALALGCGDDTPTGPSAVAPAVAPINASSPPAVDGMPGAGALQGTQVDQQAGAPTAGQFGPARPGQGTPEVRMAAASGSQTRCGVDVNAHGSGLPIFPASVEIELDENGNGSASYRITLPPLIDIVGCFHDENPNVCGESDVSGMGGNWYGAADFPWNFDDVYGRFTESGGGHNGLGRNPHLVDIENSD